MAGDNQKLNAKLATIAKWDPQNLASFDDLSARNEVTMLVRKTAQGFDPLTNLDDSSWFRLPHYDATSWGNKKKALDKLIAIDKNNIKIEDVEDAFKVTSNLGSKYAPPLLNLRAAVNGYQNTFPMDTVRNKLNPTFTTINLSPIHVAAQLCKEIEHLLPRRLPLLVQGSNGLIGLSQRQCASILANMFFCTLNDPGSNSNRARHNQMHDLLQDIDKNDKNAKYTQAEDRDRAPRVEKLKCLISYFESFEKRHGKGQGGLVTFERKIVDDGNLPDWEESQTAIRPPCVLFKGTIEDAEGLMQVDFANQKLGGGALSKGTVQEEIMFSTHPECLVGVVFSDQMQDSEAIEICGVEKYVKHAGYGSGRAKKDPNKAYDGFQYIGPTDDPVNKVDSLGRKYRKFIAIDAIDFAKDSGYSENFKARKIKRELNKAYVGFSRAPLSLRGVKNWVPEGVSTGKWGCGAFLGDVMLKFLIQLMAASELERDMLFFNFEDKLDHEMLERVEEKIQQIQQEAANKGANSPYPQLQVRHLYRVIKAYKEFGEWQGFDCLDDGFSFGTYVTSLFEAYVMPS